MGEVHPAARKIVVEFTTTDLAHPECANLTEPQRRKLIKIVGVRYNPDTDVVKMSCEKFEHAAQNKRYLGDLVGQIVAECKDPEADTFEDVPLDFRHHKSKKVLTYPAEWKLSPERVKALMEVRAERRKGAEKKVLVDGRKEVQRYAQLTEGRREGERVPVMAGLGGRSQQLPSLR
jgi:small subunit ribosomal protein S35